jgi:hypothetical protein
MLSLALLLLAAAQQAPGAAPPPITVPTHTDLPPSSPGPVPIPEVSQDRCRAVADLFRIIDPGMVTFMHDAEASDGPGASPEIRAARAVQWHGIERDRAESQALLRRLGAGTGDPLADKALDRLNGDGLVEFLNRCFAAYEAGDADAQARR